MLAIAHPHTHTLQLTSFELDFPRLVWFCLFCFKKYNISFCFFLFSSIFGKVSRSGTFPGPAPEPPSPRPFLLLCPCLLASFPRDCQEVEGGMNSRPCPLHLPKTAERVWVGIIMCFFIITRSMVSNKFLVHKTAPHSAAMRPVHLHPHSDTVIANVPFGKNALHATTSGFPWWSTPSQIGPLSLWQRRESTQDKLKS